MMEDEETSSYFGSNAENDNDPQEDKFNSFTSSPKMDIDDDKDENESEITNSGNYADEEEENTPSSSSQKENMIGGAVKAIDRSVSNQICSNQVIVTLSTAVKELVENSLDAGATSVEVRLVDYGAESIEIIDNGSGVGEEDFEGLGLKHHTSKLREFEDLITVATFGFRGEALSSLCALGDVTITTRSKSKNAGGYRLEFSHEGKLTRKTPIARDFGTTVTVRNLFATLPVRRQEFVKNKKKEYLKMVNTMNAYGIIAKGVRISFSQKTGNSSYSSVFLIPKEANSLKERIVTIYPKILASLLEIEQEDVIAEDEALTEFGLTKDTFVNDKFRLEGYISKPNEGSREKGKQYLFVNGRPCDMPKLTKIINEVYHIFSRSHQTPFLILNITTVEQGGVDMNVTPDKRQLFLRNEKSLFALVKASLMSLFTQESSSFNTSSQKLSQTYLTSSESSQYSPMSQTSTKDNSLGLSHSSTRFFDQQYSSSEVFRNSRMKPSTSSYKSGLSSLKERFSFKPSSKFPGPSASTSSNSNLHSKRKSSSGWILPKSKRSFVPCSPEAHAVEVVEDEKDFPESEPEIEESEPICKTDSEQEIVSSSCSVDDFENNELESPFFKSGESEATPVPVEKEKRVRIIYDDELGEDLEAFLSSRPSVPLPYLDFESIKTKLLLDSEKESLKRNYAQNFHAKLTDPSAEQELRKQITKEMFSDMQILGQFNLGFIIAKLPSSSDLFIIDQHASDEKWNFEQLQMTTVLQTHSLLKPLDLHLPSVSENVVLDHLDVFRTNGFDFSINMSAEPTQRIKLTKLPYSKSCQFVKSDVDELIFMLEDESPGSSESHLCRPSKIREMLASRACRKSVMIGKALEEGDMRRIVTRMGEMDQPWNCPHGRPTMRHLFNLNLLPDYPG